MDVGVFTPYSKTGKLSADYLSILELDELAGSLNVKDIFKNREDILKISRFKHPNVVELKTVDNEIEPVMRLVSRVYMMNEIKRDFAFFVGYNILPNNVGDIWFPIYQKYIRDLATITPTLIQAFDIPDEFVLSPLANDWVGHTAKDRKRELPFAKL